MSSFPNHPLNHWFLLHSIPKMSHWPLHPEHPVNYLFPTGPPSPPPFLRTVTSFLSHWVTVLLTLPDPSGSYISCLSITFLPIFSQRSPHTDSWPLLPTWISHAPSPPGSSSPHPLPSYQQVFQGLPCSLCLLLFCLCSQIALVWVLAQPPIGCLALGKLS